MAVSSIFNDVIGPVMRGPSSSHCAASLRIGRLCRDLMGGDIRQVIIQYDPNGSLATTHKSQGSDMGLFGGFLGWEADDERLPRYEAGIAAAGIDIQIRIEDIRADHPNTYKLTLFNGREMREVIALSLGGGMIEVIGIDGAPVSMAGDYYETLIFSDRPEQALEWLNGSDLPVDEVQLRRGRQQSFVQVKAQEALPEELQKKLNTLPGTVIRGLAPVLPVRSRKDLQVPFLSCREMLDFNRERRLSLWELALEYESARGGISRDEVFEKMRRIVRIMDHSIQQGLRGTEYADRILGPQSLQFDRKMQEGALVGGDLLNTIIKYVTAMMEVKSSMGVIVAAPTAGACGALPGAILGATHSMGLSEDQAVQAMLAAGMIGVFISEGATFAAEVGGCQAECGSGSGMAAAGLVHLAGGTLAQSISAASQALQNSLGMICDPIANRVEAPCLGRNVMAASNALSCANMALADFDHLIPLDEVITGMDKVGKSIAHELRCTGLGGMADTPTARAIEERLNQGLEPLGEAARKFKYC